MKCERNIFLGEIADQLLVFAFFFLPFVNFSPVACGTIVLCSLISILISVVGRETVDLRDINKASFAVLAFMVVTMFLSLPVVEDMKQFTRLEFQLRLPMLLFPFAFLFRGFLKFDVRRAMFSFALGSFATSLVVFIVFAISLVTAFDNIPYSLNNILICFQCVVGIVLHRTYLCFNLVTGLLIFYFLFSDRWDKRKLLAILFLMIYTAVFVYMTDARISLVVFLWVVFAVSIREFKRRIEGWKLYVSLLIVFALSIFIMMRSARINNIIVNLLSSSLSYQDLDPRFRIWHCGWLLFEQSPHQWIGTGTGSVMGSLPKIYEQEGFLQAIESRWEMHNQFLEVLVENGVVGLLFLLLLLFVPFFMRNVRRPFYQIWIPALCISLFFESMLSRSLGTYPIIAILVLAGLSDGKESAPVHPIKRKIVIALYLIAVVSLSVKYIMKDKRTDFSMFQRNFERVDDLPGDVPECLKGKYGLKIDSTTTSEAWHNYATMFYCLDRCSLAEADSFNFSAYVYVSEDFNAEILSLRIEERQSSSLDFSYDFTQKATWQKLRLSGKGLKGSSLFLITTAKEDCHNFDCLTGYAIFADPIIEIIR